MPSRLGQEENKNFSSLLLQHELGLNFISFLSSNLFNLSSLIGSGYSAIIHRYYPERPFSLLLMTSDAMLLLFIKNSK